MSLTEEITLAGIGIFLSGLAAFVGLLWVRKRNGK